MSVERKLILLKLIGFLTGEISKNEIYEWALFVAVSQDYESLIKDDKLAEQIMQFLIDIDKPRTTTTPTKKILEYFIACLENKKEFSVEEYKVLISDQPAKPGAAPAAQAMPQTFRSSIVNVEVKPVLPEHHGVSVAPVPAGPETLGSKLAKFYVLAFIVISIILNLFMCLKPDFLLKAGEVAPPSGNVWRDAFPHLFYAITMIGGLFLKGPRILFYILFFIAAWGMFFYWYAITVFVLANKWPAYYLVILAPLLTLPPTMMFLIMLNRWFTRRT